MKTSNHLDSSAANQICSPSSSDSPDMVWKVLAGVARHAVTQHDYAMAAKYYHQSLNSAIDAFGPGDLRIALILLDCADLCCLQYDFKQARLLNHRVKRILEHLGAEPESHVTRH